MAAFVVKDSGAREEFDSGMVRDVEDDKTDYTLAVDGPMFERWAEHLTQGAKKYIARNWMQARGMAEYMRFRRSAFRHFMQWYWGEVDEDHAAAVFFNINGAEFVKESASARDGTKTEATPPSTCPQCHGDDCGDTGWVG